jgi:hypothetical protein
MIGWIICSKTSSEISRWYFFHRANRHRASLRLRRKSDLGLNHGLADARHRFAAAPNVEPEVAANVVERDRDQQIVDVVSAEMGVAVGGDDLENAVVQLENRDVERAAAQIVNHHDAVLLFVQAVGERCRRRFVHQPQNIQPGDASGIFRRLALRVVEVCGDGDDGLSYGRSEKTLGVALQLAQHQRRNLRRRVGALANLDAQNFSLVKILRQLEGKQFQLFLYIFAPRPIRRLTE